MRQGVLTQFSAPQMDTDFEKLHPCRFSNFVSYSQIKCHRGVIYDIGVRRIGPQRTTSAALVKEGELARRRRS